MQLLSIIGFASAMLTVASASALKRAVAGPPRGSYFCPGENGKLYTSETEDSEYSFRLLCDVDWPVGVAGARNGTVVRDIQAIVASSVRDCIDQCALQRASGGACSAVVYGADIGLALSRGGITGNCFLKDQPGRTDVADHSGQVEAAYLYTL